jgi:hypothetical protein
VGVIILSGIGAIATSNDDQTIIHSNTLQSKLEAKAKGGLRITLTIENVGNDPFKGNINGNITIRAKKLLVDGSEIIPGHGLTLQPNQSITFKSGVSFGIGLCEVTVTMDIDDDGKIDGQASKNGILFGPFVLLGGFQVPLP